MFRDVRPIGDETALWDSAARVLDANWTGRATAPSPGLYPHQWGWDSLFVALGLARHRRDRAEQELLSLFAGQWSDGFVPHIVFNDDLPRAAYYPGPELWRSAADPRAPRAVRTSGLINPPLHALAALRLRDGERGRSFLARLYPALAAHHRYLASVRDLDGSGLIAICHPWESGQDNSPAWDRPLGDLRPPPAAYAPSHPLHGPATGEDHDRYAWLAAVLRDAGYSPGHLRDEHPFAVQDPLVNGTYLASLHALAEIASLVGADPVPHREAAGRVHAALLERLWDPATGCFRAYDLRGGRPLPVVTIATFGPLLDPDLPAPILRRLADLLLSSRFAGAAGYPVPACDVQAPAFDRGGYWRGPTWINTNWLVWHGACLQDLPVVAELLRGATLRLVRQSGFREFFDPFDGTGRGGHDHSWSAALVLDLLGAR
ncbi:MGH1-like glycoside hydrolase domain-containing protein [Actinomadura rubteroloni]|uniref:MGH1-like glycoside hydrolase domain-containing protein n=1 Tax=Actinomadura rubteroloni TaxID=1926885 RepID=UPI000CD9865F